MQAARQVIILAVGALAAASAEPPLASTCAAEQGCAHPQDHLLIQTKPAAAAVVGRRYQDESIFNMCQLQSVRRRRRNAEMRSCRRRHSSPGHDDTDDASSTWTCNEQENVMVCDAHRVGEAPSATIFNTCQSQSVQRRRRNAEMRSCRRRHSSPGHHDTDDASSAWTCNEQENVMVCDTNRVGEAPSAPAGPSDGVIGYPARGAIKAAGRWCAVQKPPSNWNLKSCPFSGRSANTRVKVLTYNLFWWNLFDRKGGAGRSAGKLIARTGGAEGYDIMGFQECDDRWRVLKDAKAEGLAGGEYDAINGGRALAIVYRKSRWSLLSKGEEDVGEDSPEQYYGKRSAHWVRLQDRSSGQTVFFMNHHGPLPVGSGGGCTGSATSFNILRVIADNAHSSDAIIVLGDFNAHPRSSRIQELDRRLRRVFSGKSMGGVDHIYSNCRASGSGKNLGKGMGEHGSDHDALSATFKL